MTTLAQLPPFGAPSWLRWIARGLILAWAALWIWFNVLAAFGEFHSAGFGGLAGHLGFAAIVLAVAAIAWRWDADGGLVLQALFHNEAYLLAPLSDPPPQVPVGRWFHVEAEFRAASDVTGKMVVWLDGRRVYELTGRPTVAPESLEFMVSSFLLDLDPSPVDLYVDDVVISRSRTTPAGRLHASD